MAERDILEDLGDLHGCEAAPDSIDERAEFERQREVLARACERGDSAPVKRARKYVEDWDARVADCWKCSGTGRYSWQKRGAGGRAVVVSGLCFQCRGKGWVSARDEARTGAYWCHRAGAGE